MANKHSLRVIISGGYAVDGFLGRITRPHNDVDVQIYSNSGKANDLICSLIDSIKKEVDEFIKLKITDKGRKEFYHEFFVEGNGSGFDIYYLLVDTDPFSDKKKVVKSDGSKTPVHKYETNMVMLEGVTFEAQDPIVELVDRIYKRELRGEKKRPEHEHDIKNLRMITDSVEVSRRLEELR